MNGYEKFIKIMRDESKRGVSVPFIGIGEMTSSDSCKIGSLELDNDDLLIAEHLTKNYMHKLKIDVSSSHTVTDNSEYIKPLKKGDVVLLIRISEEKYAIIERMV